MEVLKETVDSEEFADWLAFQSIDPATEERADLRSAIVATVIANVFKGKGGRSLKPQDFMPYVERRAPSQEELKQKLWMWGQAMQAKQNRRKRMRVGKT